MKKTIICILLSLMSGLAAVAQQFTVERFRPLPNDITAYMQPVKDLNGEACALVKVVGDKDFVFSSPLGIVKRVDEVGETWIYLPHGTRLLTLKHPRWGVLRNYRFPSPLESRLTYELVVLPPVQPVSAEGSIPFPRLHPAGFLPAPHDRTAVSGVPLRPRRIREPWRWVGLLHAGIGSGGSSFGLRLGAMRRESAAAFAEEIQSRLNTLSGRQVSALKGDFFMLECTNAPSVLVECGFLSNEAEAYKLSDEAYQEKLAWAIHLGIMQYIHETT